MLAALAELYGLGGEQADSAGAFATEDGFAA
jgi:hypothetical protein